jgi:hypothetical protein
MARWLSAPSRPPALATRHSSLVTCLCFVLFLVASASALGQAARFSGAITDNSGAAIPNAQVRVLNLDSLVSRDTKTDATGNFTAPYLDAGRYQITVSADGFAHSQSRDLSIAVGQSFVYNVQLGVEGSQQTVNVDAGLSSASQVNTENSEISGTITGKEVTGLQLNGRNFTQLITLTPGVSNQTQQDEAKVGVLGSVSYSVNGGRTEYNSFSVDGSETLNAGINKDHSTLIVYPSVDAIQEIKVLTSNYGAQYPSTGNGTTLVTTKSGTNTLHGNIYEFLRNEAFNSKGYFDVTNGAPLYRRNDFGGTIGGPVVIPHLYNGRNKTFFFFSEEARLEKTPTAYRQAVPSLAERGGDFSDVCPVGAVNGSVIAKLGTYPDCPSASGGAFLYPQIGPIAPYAAAILGTGILPVPNSYTGCNGGPNSIGSCYLADVSLPTYYREELFRIDHAVTERMQASFRYIHDEWDTTTPIPQFTPVTNSFPTIQNRFYGPGLSLTGRVTNIFSSTLLNEFVVSYTDSYITLADVPAPYVHLQRPDILNGPPCSDAGEGCGMGSIFNNGFGGKMPGIAFGGNNAVYGGYGFSLDTSYEPWEHSNPTYSFADNISKTIGKHNLTFGGQWVIFQRNQLNGPSGAASGDVQGLVTFSNEQSVYTTGNAFADFLSQTQLGTGAALGTGGIPASFQQDSAQARYYQRYQIAEPYLQDDWKVTSRLTVNAGLRMSLFGTYHEKNHNAYNWVPSAFNLSLARTVKVSNSGALLSASTGLAEPIYINGSVNPAVTNGLVQCGVNGVPDGCMTGHLWNPAPRVGLAWDPLGNGKNSIRAGYGIFFEHGTSDEANTGSLEGGAPVVLSMAQLSPLGVGCIGNGAAGCPGAGPGAYPLNVTSIPTKAVWSNVQQWSMSVEHEFPRNVLATFAYVGSKGTHLTAESEANQLNPIPKGTSPFGAGQPLLGSTCGDLFQNNNLPTNPAFGTGFDGAAYHIPGGAVIGAASPGFVNMKAACFGYGGSQGGGSADPASFREYAPGMGQIYSLQNVANSAYNAFQAALREASGPFTLGVAYTYSHSLDNASDRSDATFVNSFDLKSNRASSAFDERHLLHVSYMYDLPILRAVRGFMDARGDKESQKSREPSTFGQGRVLKTMFDGWQLSGLTTFESGIPFTVVNGGSGTGNTGVSVLDNAGVYNGLGSGSYPDRVASVSLHKKIPAGGNNGSSVGPLLLNPGAFAAPQGLTFGNAGRNSLNNPHRLNFDSALQKTFGITERTNLMFRAEAFNVFNNTQFRIYDPTLGNQPENTVSCYSGSAASGYSAAGDANTNCLTGSSFLHPVDAHRPRTIQFGMKLAF